MSRIEQALEKAKKMREPDGHAGPAEKKVLPAMVRHVMTNEAAQVNNPYLVTLTEPDSPIAEEYRKLKSMVVKLTKNGKLQNTIMVTSTLAEEGKSLTALNLAVSLAQEYDNTVLLVDADLRNPSLHKYLGVESKIGLADCLAHGISVEKALTRTAIDKLVLLPSGSRVSDPVELLLSNRMKELVKEIKHRYADRYVIFDAPPALPFAEAHSIGAAVDGVIFVIREGRAPLSNIKETLDMLKDTNMLGVVYNDVRFDRFDSHYNYYYLRSYYKEKRPT